MAPSRAGSSSRSPLITRRHWLTSAAACLTAIALPAGGRAQQPQAETTSDGFRVLRARQGTVKLRGPNETATAIWGYDGLSPGPTLRLVQGEELKVRVINELQQPTAVHWHGLRLPNAMDGVPHLTQMPIEPGQSFDYRFTPRDAGTFWYHSHFLSSEQVERGLYGALIVEERAPVEVDRDVVLVLDDWRLMNDGAIQPSFGNFHDAHMMGRIGQYITLNSEDMLNLPVKANERLRLRLINAANARVFRFRIAQHTGRMMAADGQPCPPLVVPDSVLRLAPGNRVDLFLDATLAPGSKAPILVDDLRGGELEIGRIAYDEDAPVRPGTRPVPKPLPNNPLAATLDLANAFRLDLPLDGGGMRMMMGGGMMGGTGFRGHGLPPQERVWALAGLSSSGHEGPPLFRVKQGQTVVLSLPNRTVFPHAMHVHGHHFRVLEGDGWKPYWLDTVLVESDRTERIAFVADNPGKWMIHCHMLEHQETGMATWFEVA